METTIDLILTLDEYVTAITVDEINLDLTRVLRIFPAFCELSEFLKALRTRVLTATKRDCSTDKSALVILLRVANCIKQCLENVDRDIFLHNNAILLLQNVVEEYTSVPERFQQMITRVVELFFRKWSDALTELPFNAPDIPRIVHQPTDNPTTPLLEISLEEVARQMTLIDWKHFSRISGLGIINAMKQKNCPSMACEYQPFQNQAEIILKWKQNQSNLRKFVIGTILNSHTREEFTSKTIQFWQLAEILRKMNNLSSYFAVLEGLQSFYVVSCNVITTYEPNIIEDAYDRLQKKGDLYIQQLIPPIILPLDYSCDKITEILNEMNKSDLSDKIDFNLVIKLENAASEVNQFKQCPYRFESVAWLQDRILRELDLYEKINWTDLYLKLRAKIK